MALLDTFSLFGGTLEWQFADNQKEGIVKEDVTDANAGSSRRQFLYRGVGLAGALSVGSVLAACGAGQPTSATTQEQAGSGTAASASATTLQAFLVVARYRRSKWNNLTETERDHAEEAAEVLFPDKPIP
ncbi:MAG TPA: hypothetical protein VFO07_00330, partial [Roseiflexaceae bacterium]|nr:hypothetical protein [Roseiflexaceae bacterium]